MHNESSNPDVSVLTLARPADTLTALVSSMVVHYRIDIAFCGSVYDVITALQKIPQDQLAILITRPSMLAWPHLATVLRQYPNLRLIGWLGVNEKFSDPAVSSLSGQVMVSSPEQLRSVIAGLRNSLRGTGFKPVKHGQACPEQSRGDGRAMDGRAAKDKIEPANYRLSDEELNALLGGR